MIAQVIYKFCRWIYSGMLIDVGQSLGAENVSTYSLFTLPGTQEGI